MAVKPYAGDAQRRQERQQNYDIAPTISERWPEVRSVAVDLRFARMERRTLPMPYRQIFLPPMRAFFAFLCPDPECRNGGFDLTPTIERGHARHGGAIHGTLACGGQRPTRERGWAACEIELQFDVIFDDDPPASA
ncbi:hypothetical protein [Solimonas soli]|uniref:hypothetical protein n=1 Tax=Solimonas soli TaxID=413479 RepID=UPI0004886FE8|nr:hypothetical protein [Solimonas soli]